MSPVLGFKTRGYMVSVLSPCILTYPCVTGNAGGGESLPRMGRPAGIAPTSFFTFSLNVMTECSNVYVEDPIDEQNLVFGSTVPMVMLILV